MSTNGHQHNKQLINKFRATLYDCDASQLKNQLREIFALDCEIHLAFPFGDVAGLDELFEEVYRLLLTAVPDLEGRDFIFMAGDANGDNWVLVDLLDIYNQLGVDVLARMREIDHAEFGPWGLRREYTLFDETAVWKQIVLSGG